MNVYTSTALDPFVNANPSTTLNPLVNVNASTALDPFVNANPSTTLNPLVNVNPSTTFPLWMKNIVTSSLPTEASKISLKSVQFVDSNRPIQGTHPIAERRSLDQWIDELDPNNLTIPDTNHSRNIQMELLIQQRLPRQELIVFAGEADKWIEFVSKFCGIVHKQPYLDSFQKHTYLSQHLKGEALKSIEGFTNDDQGYVSSLKKLKYLFGNKVVVAQSVIQRITKRKQVHDSDPKALANLYFEISTCLNTLLKMNCVADIYSTNLLRQTLSKLPVYLQRKWSEYSLVLRRNQEPNLYHLEKLLQDRVMAARDPYLNNDGYKKLSNMHNRTSPEDDSQEQKRRCSLCNKDHWLYRCPIYKSKGDTEKVSFVRKKRLCFNCLSPKHNVKACKSKKHCFVDGCKIKHHTTLHQGLKKGPDKQDKSPQPKLKSSTTKDQQNSPKVDEAKSEDPSIPPANLPDREKIETTINRLVEGRSHVYLQVVPVRVKNVRGQEVPVTTDSSWDYIGDLGLKDIDSSQVQLLIGADVPDVLVSHDFRKSKKGYPYASKTRLGWTLLGVYDGTSDPIESRLVALTRNLGIRSELSEVEYSSFWETESFGTEVKESKSRSIDDQRNQEILDKETEFKDGHYIVPMLWKKDVNLSENEEALCRTATTWYIPHHGVTSVNKPGKVRMVFDAAAQSHGESLNSNLYSGPDLLNSLLGVLLRFRRHRVAVVADIEAMFCQVRFKKADMDANRFLWRDDPKSHKPPDHYKLIVHIFGLTDSPCAATYALQRAAIDQANDYPPEVIKAVLRNLYVDDLLMSYSNATSVKETSHGVISLLNNKGFNLTKFQSNDESVLKDLPTEKLATQPTGIKLYDKVMSRALGVHWDLETDCFVYKVNVEVDRSKPCTKRSILKKTATIYDPLGLLTSITLVAKLFMQELWRDKFEWNEKVSKSLKNRYEDWLCRMSDIASTVAVPRSLNLEGDQDVQQHIFCDASEKAFAALAYVRIEIYPIV
ncbi:uncharacterized protein [Clytia hemisphaerica]|uniref:uncharacterized protein n=1 Tax=Clytia hemisphaerica TaxID=252671 RepID=UPI0034D54B6F